MKRKNSCYTYFRIVGDFNPQEIANILNLPIVDFFVKGDKRKGGKTRYEFSSLSLCKCDEYDVYIENQMLKTITPLLDKIDILNSLKEKYDLKYFLEVVPKLNPKEITPCLSPSLEVMDFCLKTKTEMDIDLYID